MSKWLAPDPAEARVRGLSSAGGALRMDLEAARPQAQCPGCGGVSRRVHSWYWRRLADLPWAGRAMVVRLRTRRWFCDHGDCPRRIFAERFEETAGRGERRSRRQREALAWLGLGLGGEGAARAAARQGMRVSGDTILRLLRRLQTPASDRIRRVGVDDWAWRRGQRYGTILVDLETHRPVDLLPTREAEEVAAWLRLRPDIELISRDRAGTYAQAAALGAPQAVQVADRWHLIRNLRDALEAVVRGCRFPPEDGPSPPETPARVDPATQPSSASRERRQERYRQMLELIAGGSSRRQAAARLGLDRRTIRRWLRVGAFPERARPRRASRLDPWLRQAESLVAESRGRGSGIYRALQRLGLRGSESNFRRWFAARFPHLLQPARAAEPAWHPPAPRRLAALLLGIALPDSPRELAWLDRACALLPRLGRCRELARQFRHLLQCRAAAEIDGWIEAARHSPLHRFARSLLTDLAAVRQAASSECSQGPVEGAVNRLKLLKRQMYGRAKLDLLRVRVCRPA